MKPLSKQNCFSRRSRVGVLGIVAVVMIVVVHGLEGLATRAAVRLPEEAVSLEPWLLPSGGVPPAMDLPHLPELAPTQDALRRTASGGAPRVVADRARRQSTGRREKQALAEFMGLVGPSRQEQTFMQRFESFQGCREFVAINC